MPDFSDEKVTISKNGAELASMEPTLDQAGETIGGSVVCRDQFGNVAVALTGGDEETVAALAGGTILIRNGLLWLVNSNGASRVRIFAGEQSANEDGGTIFLQAAGDLQAGAAGDNAAIVLNASKRSLVIHGTDGKPIFKIDPSGNLLVGGSQGDGDLFLRDKSGKTRVELGATEQRLRLLAADGKQVANLGTNGDLDLGGGGVDGDIVLRDGLGNVRVRLGADEHRLSLIDSAGKPVVVLGISNGNLNLAGEINTQGNLKRQRITERSRKVNRNQSFDLFQLGQDGAFVIELAAGYSQKLGGKTVRQGTYYASWSVLTNKTAGVDEGVAFMSLALNQTTSSPPEGFWQAETEPGVFFVDGKCRFAIGEVSSPDVQIVKSLNNATLCVRALYGTLLDF